MSVGDRRGYLKRLKILRRRGHTPNKTGLSISQLIDRGKAARQAEAGRGSSKKALKIYSPGG